MHFNEPIDTDKDGNQLTLVDIIADDESVADKIELRIKAEQLYKYIEKCLSKSESEIIRMRYGLLGQIPMTQREIAKKLNISRSYISRIEKKAIEALRDQYEGKHISR